MQEKNAMNGPVIIVGRTLENYRSSGGVPATDAVILECLRCHQKLAVSRAGYDRWQTKITPGTEFSGALCTLCAAALAAAGKRGVNLEVGPEAIAQAARDPSARRALELIKWAAGLSGEGK